MDIIAYVCRPEMSIFEEIRYIIELDSLKFWIVMKGTQKNLYLVYLKTLLRIIYYYYTVCIPRWKRADNPFRNNNIILFKFLIM